jgi:hypothetical protein
VDANRNFVDSPIKKKKFRSSLDFRKELKYYNVCWERLNIKENKETNGDLR